MSENVEKEIYEDIVYWMQQIVIRPEGWRSFILDNYPLDSEQHKLEFLRMLDDFSSFIGKRLLSDRKRVLLYKKLGDPFFDKEEVEKRLQHIGSKIDDPEVAHSLEDDLFRDFVEFISKFSSDDECRRLSKSLLTVKQFDFPRWTA